MKFFKLRLTWKNIEYRKFIIVVIAALFFGMLFFFLNEPVPILFSDVLLVVVLYTLFVSLGEELMFRFVVFRLAERAFSFKKAIHLQALVFALIHLVGISYIYHHYFGQGTYFFNGAVGVYINIGLYFIALYVFSVVAGYFVGASKGKIYKYNLVYAILLHWGTNVVSILLRGLL